jgi:hypothetical protein
MKIADLDKSHRGSLPKGPRAAIGDSGSFQTATHKHNSRAARNPTFAPTTNHLVPHLLLSDLARRNRAAHTAVIGRTGAGPSRVEVSLGREPDSVRPPGGHFSTGARLAMTRATSIRAIGARQKTSSFCDLLRSRVCCSTRPYTLPSRESPAVDMVRSRRATTSPHSSPVALRGDLPSAGCDLFRWLRDSPRSCAPRPPRHRGLEQVERRVQRDHAALRPR